MAFPFSWTGEVLLNGRDGPLPTADVAAGRIDAAIGRIVPISASRPTNGLEFRLPKVDRERFFGTLRQKLKPFLCVSRGSVRVKESPSGLRIHWELRFGHAYIFAGLALLVFIPVLAAGPPAVLGLVWLGLNAVLVLGSILSDITEFPKLIRRAVRGEVELGPERPLL